MTAEPTRKNLRQIAAVLTDKRIAQGRPLPLEHARRRVHWLDAGVHPGDTDYEPWPNAHAQKADTLIAGSYLTYCFIPTGARVNRMELVGLEPTTSWVRSRIGGFRPRLQLLRISPVCRRFLLS